MHGRPRTAPKALTPEQQAKLENYIKHKAMVLAARKKNMYTPATAALTAGIIKINPDFYTVFNFRKEIVLDMIAKSPERKAEILKEELETMTQALLQQPKSYYVWHHRVWVMEQGYDDYLAELENCAKFLKMDPRNFHCWRHRHDVARLALEKGLITLQDELNFTHEKIVENFSNYSAWHYRSVVLLKIQSQAAQQANADAAEAEEKHQSPEAVSETSKQDETKLSPIKHWEKLLRDELKLVGSAIGMEPNDQSVWLYHRWLVAQILATPSSTVSHLPEIDASEGRQMGAEISSSQKMLNPLSILPTITLEKPSLDPKQEANPDSTGREHVFTLPLDIQLELIEQEIAFLRDKMLALEPNSRWILNSVAILYAARYTIQYKLEHSKSSSDTTQIDALRDTTKQQIGEIFARLAELDPFRVNYYLYVKKSILSQVSATSA